MNPIREGVRDAFDFWLSEHPVTMNDLIEVSLKAAFAEWLEAHSAEIVEAIAKGKR